jgi:hypothetical protein
MTTYIFIALVIVFSLVGFVARWLWNNPPCLRCGKFLQVNDAGYCSTCAAVRRLYQTGFTEVRHGQDTDAKH